MTNLNQELKLVDNETKTIIILERSKFLMTDSITRKNFPFQSSLGNANNGMFLPKKKER